MMYPFMTLPDETEIVHSHDYKMNDNECVKVYMEKPIAMNFKTACKRWRCCKECHKSLELVHTSRSYYVGNLFQIETHA